MDKASPFVAALLATLFVQVLHPISPQIPYWQDICAAVAGALLAGLVTFVGKRLKDWRSVAPRASH
jgi:hypothetical protein